MDALSGTLHAVSSEPEEGSFDSDDYPDRQSSTLVKASGRPTNAVTIFSSICSLFPPASSAASSALDCPDLFHNPINVHVHGCAIAPKQLERPPRPWAR
jgi:hypothetical protein